MLNQADGKFDESNTCQQMIKWTNLHYALPYLMTYKFIFGVSSNISIIAVAQKTLSRWLSSI